MLVSELMAALVHLPGDREVEMWVEHGSLAEPISEVRTEGSLIVLAAEMS